MLFSSEKNQLFSFFRDTLQSTSESFTYIFDMTALTEHLRAEGEMNKSASYFNVDILKYQVKVPFCKFIINFELS